MGLRSGKVSRQTKWSQKKVKTDIANNSASAVLTAVIERDVVSHVNSAIDCDRVQFHDREIVVYADRYSRNNITTTHNQLIEITTAPEIYFFRPIDIASKHVLVAGPPQPKAGSGGKRVKKGPLVGTAKRVDVVVL